MLKTSVYVDVRNIKVEFIFEDIPLNLLKMVTAVSLTYSNNIFVPTCLRLNVNGLLR